MELKSAGALEAADAALLELQRPAASELAVRLQPEARRRALRQRARQALQPEAVRLSDGLPLRAAVQRPRASGLAGLSRLWPSLAFRSRQQLLLPRARGNACERVPRGRDRENSSASSFR